MNTATTTFFLPLQHYTSAQYGQFVGARAIAEGLQARCLSMLYHEIEFSEDEKPVRAWANKFSEIYDDITLGDDDAIQRAYRLQPLIKTLNLDYILKYPNGWDKL
jgi:hypothetical protein